MQAQVMCCCPQSYSLPCGCLSLSLLPNGREWGRTEGRERHARRTHSNERTAKPAPVTMRVLELVRRGDQAIEEATVAKREEAIASTCAQVVRGGAPRRAIRDTVP